MSTDAVRGIVAEFLRSRGMLTAIIRRIERESGDFRSVPDRHRADYWSVTVLCEPDSNEISSKPYMFLEVDDESGTVTVLFE